MFLLKDNLLKIQKQFLCCEPINTITFQDILQDLSWEDQELLINLTIQNSLVLRYPIKKSYQQSFLRNIITYLESKSIEIHDGLYDIFCKLKSEENQDKWFYKHYILDVKDQNKRIVSLKESASFVSEGTTGLCSWQASHALAEYCLEHSELIDDKSILELGAGAGLLGLFLWTICVPKKYMFSDCHPSVLKLLSDNVSMNLNQDCYEHFDFPDYVINKGEHFKEVESPYIKSFRNDNEVELAIVNLPWEDMNIEDIPECDIILATDVVYDSSIIPALCNCLHLLLTKNHINRDCIALIACTVRNEQTIAEFVKEIESLDLEITKEKTMKCCKFYGHDKTPVEMYRISFKNTK